MMNSLWQKLELPAIAIGLFLIAMALFLICLGIIGAINGTLGTPCFPFKDTSDCKIYRVEQCMEMDYTKDQCVTLVGGER
jgi:hypothetical protein